METNSVEPEQAAPSRSSLFWVYTVCSKGFCTRVLSITEASKTCIVCPDEQSGRACWPGLC